MTTYTKETALYDTGAIGDGISEAGETASKYITVIDQNGIKVHAENNPTTNYTQIDGNGMEVFEGGISVASFGTDGARLGEKTGAHSEIDANGQRFYAEDGTTQLANIGYGMANTDSGTGDNPYFTFGIREDAEDALEFSSSSTYPVGEIRLYDGKPYICKVAVTTAGAWNSANWARLIGSRSVAEGNNIIAAGANSYAQGAGSIALGANSQASGLTTKAFGNYSHAEGYHTEATGSSAHAEGRGSVAVEQGSHAEGGYTFANGLWSHAEGYGSKANGGRSHASGLYTKADGDDQTVVGRYNNNDANNLFEVGNGTSDTARSNAFAVNENGIADLYKITECSISTGASINAHGYIEGASKTIPTSARVSGYNLVGVMGWSTGNYRIIPHTHYVVDNTHLWVGFSNTSASNVSTSVTITFRLLWLKGTEKA